MKNIFFGCKSLRYIPSISKWNTSNVSDMSFMFTGAITPDLLNNLSNYGVISDINEIVENYLSNTSDLYLQQNIDKYIKNLNTIFSECSSLISLPDISKWKTSKVKNMSNMFSLCSKLDSLPDISKWNLPNLENI